MPAPLSPKPRAASAPGYLSDASGPEGARFGRDPVTGRAYKADGTVRKAREALTPADRLAKVAEATQAAHAAMGRAVAATVPALAALTDNASTVRGYLREARAYATPEARAARRAYFLRMADACEAKGEAAVAYLSRVGGAADTVRDLFAAVGAAVAKAGTAPTAAEAEALLARVLTPEARAVLAEAGTPAGDPFAPWRRDAAEAEAADDDGADA